LTEQGYSVSKAAGSRGINPNMLYKWKDKQEAESKGKALPEDERDELKRLRRENIPCKGLITNYNALSIG
jgi:transposase